MPPRHLLSILCFLALVAPTLRADPDRYANLDSAKYLGEVRIETTLTSRKPFTEGPAVDANGVVFFTNLTEILAWESLRSKTLATFRKPSNGTNGQFFDAQGRLLCCESADLIHGRVTRTDMKTGQITVLCDSFNGFPLGAPNDVTTDSRGRIYFTSQIRNTDPAGGNINAVYRIDPDGKTSRVLATPEIDVPNGLAISPDDKIFYLIESDGRANHARNIRGYDLRPDGSVANMRVIYDFYPGRGGDGMRIDAQGNLIVAAGLHHTRRTSETLDTKPGIHVISPQGKLLAFAETPVDTLTNCAFGDGDLRTLYVTCDKYLLSIRMQIPGMASYQPGSGSEFDTSCKPGDDFFQYVNGIWLKHNPIPPEYSDWDVFSELHDRNLGELHAILDDLLRHGAGLDDERRKLRDFYLTATDEAAMQKQGAAALAAEWEKIAGIASSDDLVALLADFRSRGLDFVFGSWISPDEKQSSRYALHLWQGGLGLPERDYYLGDSEEYKKTREAYREHVIKMLTLLGDSRADASAGADAVLRIETRLAEASRTPTALRDAETNYNKRAITELDAQTPAFHWPQFLQTAGAANISEVVVGQPEFFKSLDALFKTIPTPEWRVYLRWHLIDTVAEYLGGEFERENFHFRDEIMRGVKEMPPRWKRAVRSIDWNMGEALGKLYVDKHFPPAAHQRMAEMVENLAAAYKERIRTRDWMGADTKKQALIKLAAMNRKIGFPVKWRDYGPLEIKPDSYLRNILRSWQFEWQYRVAARLNQPVDRNEWDMTPPTVNAYYSSERNEIVFPAGILQPPFFDLQADDACNYGAIGAIIGHEMTHGFDDQGSRSDADGNLRNWWTADDRARFEAKTARLVKQFDACVAIDNLHVNGQLTLGENLADLGGVNIAYAAYLRSLGGKAAPTIGGLTGPQRFFIGYARAWRGHIREAEARVRLRTDPHSPSRFRSNIPLSNVAAFYDAFHITASDAMYRPPEDRVEVW